VGALGSALLSKVAASPASLPLSNICLEGGVLQVDIITAERYFPHQIQRLDPKVLAPGTC
jgi:hypothetical protein